MIWFLAYLAAGIALSWLCAVPFRMAVDTLGKELLAVALWPIFLVALIWMWSEERWRKK